MKTFRTSSATFQVAGLRCTDCSHVFAGNLPRACKSVDLAANLEAIIRVGCPQCHADARRVVLHLRTRKSEDAPAYA